MSFTGVMGLVAVVSMICDLIMVGLAIRTFQEGTVESSDSSLLKRRLKRRSIIIASLLLLTLGSLGYDYYDRHYADQQQQGRNREQGESVIASSPSGPCAVRLTEGKRQDLIRFFRANLPKRTVTISFASKERDSCPYAQDLWEVLEIGSWAPPTVSRVEELGGPGVIFGASTKDIVTESFFGILSDTNDVHLDVKVGHYEVDRPQDWYIWIRDDWSEWIGRSFVKETP